MNEAAPRRVSASERIWGLVCGFSEPKRSNRILFMFKAFIDDSNMNAPPVCVLGGWVGPAKEWAKFSDCWEEALWMKPRLRYFKLAEAQNLTGEFGGWSEQSRDERLRLLVKVIEQHGFLGIANAMPLDAYKRVFGGIPDRGVQNPYFLSFYGLITRLAAYYQEIGRSEPIDFIFDVQPGQTELIIASWERFLQVVGDDLRPFIGDYPIFRDDKTTLPLQAADLGVGWNRQLAEDRFYGRPPRPSPWGGIDLRINVLGQYWTEEMMIALRNTLNLSGHP